MKYAFIKQYREDFLVSIMCEVLLASKSGFYSWVARDHKVKNDALERLMAAIKAIFKRSRATYGSPRVWRALLTMGISVAEEKVANLMRQMGLRAKSKKRFKVKTTDSKHNLPIAANLLQQNFNVARINTVWVGDITYIATGEGWLYLAAVLDLATRKIVGWAMFDSMERQLVMEALNMALGGQKPSPGLIFHSDRGSQYASHDYRNLLGFHGLIASMSGKGNCYDNAVMESFFHTLKTEFVHHEDFQTKALAKSAIFEWIEVFYNRQRMHSSIGYKTPVEFEAEIMLAA